MNLVQVTVNQDDIIFKIGDDNIVYSTDVNAFQEESGLTIQNIDIYSLEGYYLQLSELGKKFYCGNILENLMLEIKKQENNILLIIDFKDIEEVSESFLKSYTKFLLETSNKILTINMSTEISNNFSLFISNTIKQKEEEE